MNTTKERVQLRKELRNAVLTMIEESGIDSTEAAFILASVLNECMFDDGLSVTIRRVPLVFDGENGKS